MFYNDWKDHFTHQKRDKNSNILRRKRKKFFHRRNHWIVNIFHHKNHWIQKSGKRLTILTVSKLRNYFFFIGSQGRESIFFDVRNYPLKSLFQRPEIFWLRTTLSSQIRTEHKYAVTFSKIFSSQKSLYSKKMFTTKIVGYKNQGNVWQF